jgi:hypothetical protein
VPLTDAAPGADGVGEDFDVHSEESYFSVIKNSILPDAFGLHEGYQ